MRGLGYRLTDLPVIAACSLTFVAVASPSRHEPKGPPNGLIAQDLMEHGRWWVTDEGWRVLKGQATIELRKDLAAGGPAKGSRRDRKAAAASAVVSEPDAALFEALKALRTKLAQEQKVPAYVVFSDRTLAELATHRPTSPHAFREIHGIGDAKLERYGAAFLDVVQNHASKAG